MSQTQLNNPEVLHTIATNSRDLNELLAVAKNPNSDEKTLDALTINVVNFYADPRCPELLEALVTHQAHTAKSLWKLAAAHLGSVQGLGELIEKHPACTPKVKSFVSLMGKMNPQM